MIRFEDRYDPETGHENANPKAHFLRSGPYLAGVLVADCDGCVDQVGEEPGTVAVALEGGGREDDPVEELPGEVCVSGAGELVFFLLVTFCEGKGRCTGSKAALRSCGLETSGCCRRGTRSSIRAR